MLQENISEEAIIAYLKANIKNAKKEIEAALKHIQNCAYEMTMQADYEEYELSMKMRQVFPQASAIPHTFKGGLKIHCLEKS